MEGQNYKPEIIIKYIAHENLSKKKKETILLIKK